MEKESNEIRREALKLSWFMRGGLSYEHSMQLSHQERAEISGIIKEHLETTKKTGLNFF